MAKVAKLVTVSLITRVVVDDNATDEQIIETAKLRFIDKFQTEYTENVSIENDLECPYDPDMEIKFSEVKRNGDIENLIPVHINKMRCENYFWNWSSNHGDWIRGEKISEELKRAYKNPLVKSNYK